VPPTLPNRGNWKPGAFSFGGGRFFCFGLALFLALVLGSSGLGQAPATPSAKELFWAGKYVECADAARKAVAADRYSEEARLMLVAAELELGKFDEAKADVELAMESFRASIRLKWLARSVYRFHSSELVAAMEKQIRELIEGQPYRYSEYQDQVVAARFFLSQGFDPKKALDSLLTPMKKRYPEKAGAFLAAGDLALEKQDFALAAQNYSQAAKLEPGNPDAHFGVAKAFAPSDDKKAEAALREALKINPRHVPSLLFVVDQQIDAERFDLAEAALLEIDQVNPAHPTAAAYRAVIAHLKHQLDKEKSYREAALRRWKNNPAVDHLIGAKLSRNYRFAEGRVYQERALAIDTKYAPARIQLAQDLLRLGEEKAGWKLADAAYEEDGYSVTAHNLVTLQESLAKYQTLEGDGFVLRMDARESEVYGERVLGLLKRAKEVLCAKYEVTLDKPVIVEMFAKQQDFAVRTFGMPGGAGFLGVCFGNVITANSPVAQGASESNWESTLWHEFCHVVTLNKTHNKMPRWLSEGISVYEERQVQPSWGEQMNPQYRAMILGKELTPVSQLSGAFMQPPTPMHLQFAYYESSLVVEYLIEKYGLAMVKQVLTDLGAGLTVNEALARHAGAVEALDKEFAEYARKKANEMAPKADWSKPEILAASEEEQTDKPPEGGRQRGRPPQPQVSEAVIKEWLAKHETNYPALLALAKGQVAARKFDEAKITLQKLIELYPEHAGASSPLRMLSGIYREEKKPDEERRLLEKYVSLTDDDLDAFTRLAEIGEAAKDWGLVKVSSQKALAVNPMLPAPHRSAAKAAEETGDDALAAASYAALLKLDPFDVAELELKLAQALRRQGNLPAAKRHVLLSLAEAPRYRAAHQLLLEVEAKLATDSKPSVPSTPPAEAKP
jgi:cytochrome c-type biogenesis protein CcmH/NrfG